MIKAASTHLNLIQSGENVLICENRDLNAQYISIEFPVGGMYRPISDALRDTAIPGMAHYLEHMVLDDRNSAFFHEYMLKGAKCNGYTHLTGTYYNIMMKKLDFDVLNRFLDDLMFKELSYVNFKKQRDIILNEIGTTRHVYAPYAKGLRMLLKDDYDFFAVIGNRGSIQDITFSMLKKVRKMFYNPDTMNFVTFGPTDAKEIEWWLDEYQNKNKDGFPKQSHPKMADVDYSDPFIIHTGGNKRSFFKWYAVNDKSDLVRREIILNMAGEMLCLNDQFLNYHIDVLNHGIVFILDFYPGTNEIEVSNECFEKVKKHALFHFLSSFDYPDRISEKCHWLSRNHLSVEAYMDYLEHISAEEVMRLMMDVVQDMEELQVGGC